MSKNPIFQKIVMEVAEERKNPIFLQIVMEVAAERGWFDVEKNVLTDKFFMELAHQKNLEKIARGLKQDNIPLHIIVKNTGLTLQEVEAL